METNSKITQLENNKRGKFNSLKNDIYKYILYFVAIIIASTILISILYIFSTGIETIVANDLNLGQLFFGDSFNPAAGLVSMGFIVANTLWLAFLATLIAAPISIGTAIMITRILKPKSSAVLFSIVAILAAIPSVVYGAFGYYVIDQFSIKILDYEIASLFTMIIMLACMITPTITIMSVASIRLTDKKMENSSYALGANRTQTSFYITLKTAKTGIYTGILFAVGRCLAETTAISMVGSPSLVTDGMTVVWWQQSLFLGPALLAANTGETHGPFPIAPIISLFLLTTTMFVFAIMKFIEFKNSETRVVRKQTELLTKERTAIKKYEKYGIGALTDEEQSTLISIDRKQTSLNIITSYYEKPEISSRVLLQRSSISSNVAYERYKSKKSAQHNAFIFISSMFGIILLFSIVFFLLNGGFEYLNWETLTFRGMTTLSDGRIMYGLAVPLMGTYITVYIALLIALPLGIVIGICLSTYLNKEKRMGWFASYIFQVLTAIPSIVWATIASFIFATTSWIYGNMRAFEPILFLSIIMLPSIIKTVEEAGGRVKRNQVEGSYALGATVATTTRRIYLKEVFPSIISGALLATAIAMAETTIFISILPFSAPAEDMETWVSHGGMTLATAIFQLRNSYSAVLHPEVLHEIKTIGILLMILILTISFISTLIGNGRIAEGGFLGLALMVFPFGVYINGGMPILILITILIAVFAIAIVPIIKKIRKNRLDLIIESRKVNYGK